MRIIFFSFISALLVIIFCFSSIGYLERATDDFVRQLNSLDKAVTNMEWDKAKEKLAVFEEEWSKQLFIWNLLIEHREIENMEISIIHIKSYLSTESITEAKAEIAGLIKYLQHIPEIERLTVENIF